MAETNIVGFAALIQVVGKAWLLTLLIFIERARL